MALTPSLRMAGQIARELRWAEINDAWDYMAALLSTLKAMGGRVIRLRDPSWHWRSDYLVQFREEDTLPLALK